MYELELQPHLEHKRSVVCILLRRAETVVSKPSGREEVKHVKKAITETEYMKWAFKIPKKRERVEDPSKDKANARKFPVSIPYISGVCE